MNYLIHILIVFEIYLILALAMNLMAGYSGLLSLAQAAFYGIGAYVTTLLLVNVSISFIPAVILAIIFNLIASVPIIWFAIKLRDLFFILATLAWQILVFAILYNWMSVTNGPYGITGIPKPELFGITFNTLPEFALFGGIITLLTLLFFVGLHKTPLSRFFQGVRDDQLAVMTFGKSPAYYKSIAILISGGASAVAGALFATYYSYIDPTSFTVDESILIISIVLIGGLGSVKGSFAGALFYVLLPEVLRFLDIPDSVAANLRIMIFALVLILVVMFKPHGFFGNYKFE
ncbi:MAG: branched-chain amino acid ABC transporter permease [Candidatus Paceibacterota bacterium]